MDSLWTTGFGEFTAVRGGLRQPRGPWKDGKKLGGGREEIQVEVAFQRGRLLLTMFDFESGGEEVYPSLS